MMLKRTQLYLEIEQFQALKRIAEGEKGSIASIVRNAIAEYLVSRKTLVEAGWKDDPINKAIGCFEAEEGLSINHDKYLYKEFSFTDCTSFAVMEENKLNTAFSFDKNFTQYGFKILPEIMER